jgi:predicted enzyme related to lactoylglutathione lyase
VTDLERAQRFYIAVFGFEVTTTMDVPDAPADRLVQVEAPLGLSAVYLRLGNFVLELLHFDRSGNPAAASRVMNEPGLTHLSLTVDDMAATLERVVEYGGQVLDETNVKAAVMIRDPEGQIVELLAHRPPWTP